MKSIRYAIWNGEIVEANHPVFSLSSRIGQFGDALFETIRCEEGKPLWLSFHLARLNRSFKLLGWTPSQSWNAHFWKTQIDTLLKQNAMPNARLKIRVFREAEGFYLPVNEHFVFSLTLSELQDRQYVLPNKGVTLGVCPLFFKPHDITSVLKTTSSLLYVQAKIYAKNQGYDDVLLLNHYKRPCEASSSSWFWVVDDILYTPPLSEYPLQGVMREVIIAKAKELHITCKQEPAYPGILEQAQEMFLCNTIQGIRWVGSFQNKDFKLGPVTQRIAESIKKGNTI